MRSFLLVLVVTATRSGSSSCLGFLLPCPPRVGVVSIIKSSNTGSLSRFRATPEGTGESDSDASEETRTSVEESTIELNNLGIGLNATEGPPVTLRKIEDANDEGSVDFEHATTALEPTVLERLNRLELEIEAAKDVADAATLSRIDIDTKKRTTTITFDDDEVLPLSQREQSTTLTEKVTTSLKLVTILSGGTYLFAAAFGDLLTRFEWVQEWRYIWPLVGFLYAADGARALLSPDENGDGVLRGWWGIRGNGNADRVARIIQVVGGLGTVVGGAYDAFMPVWMTGPNVVTSAGIGQDGAALLCVWTAWYVYLKLRQQCETPKFDDKRNDAIDVVVSNLRHGPLLSQVILLAQLYKLGEGSFDELIS